MKYMLKTLFPYEADFLKKILRHYYEHLCMNRNTLLTRFLGFHAVKTSKGAVRHFVVMNNIFTDNLDISLKYDLKGRKKKEFFPFFFQPAIGSLHGRTAFPRKPPSEGDDLSNVMQKDLDFNRRLLLGPKARLIFLGQIVQDSEFLDRMGIMDYSLLLGIHLVERGMPKTRKRRTTLLSSLKPSLDVSAPGIGAAQSGAIESEGAHNNNARVESVIEYDDDDDSSAKGKGEAEGRLPAHPHHVKGARPSFFVRDDGGFRATDDDDAPLPEVYYMGIIDILQPYNLSKFVESKVKRSLLRISKAELSSVGPHLYGRRFQEFLIMRTGPGEPLTGKHKSHVSKTDELDKMIKKLTGLNRAELIEAYRSLQQSESPKAAPDDALVVEDVPPVELKPEEPEEKGEEKEEEKERADGDDDDDNDSDMDIVHRPND
jgi:1-phosphatidylinositol-4-phosphate 5-kinase